jgi:hypothetical protein
MIDIDFGEFKRARSEVFLFGDCFGKGTCY